MKNEAALPLLILLSSFAAGAQDVNAPAATLQTTGAPGEVSEDRTVQLHYNLRQQPLIRLEKAYPLPVFCVTNTLTDPDPIIPKPLPPASTCATKEDATKTQKKAHREIPGDGFTSDERTKIVLLPTNNSDDIVKALQSGTEFVVGKADDTHIAIFCKARNCDAPPIRAAYKQLQATIAELARPAYVRYQEIVVSDKDAAKKLVKSIPTLVDGLAAELIDETTIRIESSKRLSAYDAAALTDGITKLQDRIAKKQPLPSPQGKTQAARVKLPDVCVPKASLAQSFQPLNDDGDCDASYQKTQAANAHQIATQLSTALGKTPDFTITDDGNSVLIACNKGACEGAAFKQLEASVRALAGPAWPFSEEIDVPKETAIEAAELLTRGGIKATPLSGSRIRLTSDQPVSDPDVKARLEALSELGFGTPYPPLLQRMFYQDAANVIASLLTTPLPQAPTPLAEQAPNTGPAAPASTTTTTTSPTGVTVNVTPPAAATPAPATPAAPTTGPAPAGSLGQGMTSVGDNVVFTDTTQPSQIQQRIRLLTTLDLPRPEVLMNIWSLQASSPKGQEVEESLEKVRKAVEAHNEALQNAIDYGWAYLSREMKSPEFFDDNFSEYLTGRFVSDTPECEANASDSRPAPCLTEAQRQRWGLCKAGTYCLGYTGLFNPIRPTLTNILLGMMASRNSIKTVLTTIGCMEGKYEVYPECFPDRLDLERLPGAASWAAHPARIMDDRREYINGLPPDRRLSCEVLDEAALYAQLKEELPVALPLSCFALQASKSFFPAHAFTTFSVEQLNYLAEVPIGAFDNLPRHDTAYSATTMGLLRSAVANFLFSYKMAQEFPQELSSYNIAGSAQELNALFNPLVVAFNEDVAVFSRTLMARSQKDLPNQHSIFEIWRHNKNFIANGLVTVRGIGGVESLVDTDTQSSFDATQAQTLSQIVGNLTGQGNSSSSGGSQGAATSNSSPSAATSGSQSTGSSGSSSGGGGSSPSPVAALPATVLNGTLNPLTVASALAAITPTPTHSYIGRQLAIDITPHTLPGASSAELDVKLWAQEDSPPTVYPAGSSNGQSDTVSRVARHNVATKVRVESVKLFDLSSFSAMIQRPRTKLPIVPPLVQLPLINNLLSVPLPAAKLYYGSSAIVSAIIVPTAADLAYGIQFTADRAVFQDKSWRRFVKSRQLPDSVRIFDYHRMMSTCLAISAGKPDTPLCSNTRFWDLPSEP